MVCLLQRHERRHRDAVKSLHNFLEHHQSNPKLALGLESDVYRNTDGSPTAQKLYEIELLKGDTSAMPAIDKAIRRKIEDIARVLGVEGLLLGSTGGHGSQSLAKDKTQVLSEAVASVLTDLAWRLEHDIVTPLMLLNGFPLDLQPALVPNQVQLRDVAEVVAALVAMAQAGLADDDEAVNAVRDLVGLPHAPVRPASVDGAIPVLPRRGPKPPSKTPTANDNDDGSVDVDTDDLDDADPGAQAVA